MWIRNSRRSRIHWHACSALIPSASSAQATPLTGEPRVPPSVQTQRDNLGIGLYLARGSFGAILDDILRVPLGYSPNNPRPEEHYVARFRNAQRAGRDALRRRTPGYFAFNAMPFGGGYIYKATWYVWRNPQSGQPQTVPLPAGDLASMRRLRYRDVTTRQATTRSVRTADNVEQQRQAIQRRDWVALQELQARASQDGSLGEILSGFHGIPYADIQDIIPDLPNRPMRFQFQRDAQRVQRLDRRLREAQAALGRQLTAWVMLQTGVPNDAPQLALLQAQRRLDSLGHT